MLTAHLAECLNLTFPLGTTVQDVRDTLKHVLNVPADARARVNGQEVGSGHIVSPTDVVEFVKERGRKAVGDRVWDAEGYCRFFNLTARDLELQIQQGLRVMHLSNGTMRITESAVDQFVRGSNGGTGSEVITVIARSLERIANHFDPPPRDVIGTDYIADKLGCTAVWVAKMAAEGIIPKNCIVPGTGFGKPWKFYRSRVDAWILTR